MGMTNNTSRSSNLFLFFFRLHLCTMVATAPLAGTKPRKTPFTTLNTDQKAAAFCLGTSWCEYVSHVCRGLQGFFSFFSLFFSPRPQGRRHGSRWIVSRPASKLYPVAEQSSCSSNYFPHTGEELS